MLTESPCLPSVYEFLGLSDKLSFARVNKYWRFVSTTSPSAVIDTVGFDLSVSRLISLISRNASYIEILRVGVREPDIDSFISFLVSELNKFEKLTRIAIFSTSPDGSVRLPIRDLQRIDAFDNTQYSPSTSPSHVTSLILQIDPSVSKPTQTLLKILGPNLSTVAFLRGPGVVKSADLVSLITHTVPRAQSVYLGPCTSDIDMDEVVPHIFADRQNPIQYLQWSNASASIDTLRFVHSKVSECDFDGLGFLMFLL